MNKKELSGLRELNTEVATFLFDFYSKNIQAGFEQSQALELTVAMFKKLLPDNRKTEE